MGRQVAASIQAAGGKVFPGEAAHLLYTTMGFPIDLTTLMAEEMVSRQTHTGGVRRSAAVAYPISNHQAD